MKILHTSDWHIGHNFFKIDRNNEFREFFSWLIDTIKQYKIDILLVSGDIFDTYNPTNEALRLYYDFLNSSKNFLKKIIIIGGNHDSVKNLIAPKEILRVLDIIVVSGSSDNYCEVIEFEDFNIVAVSYIRDYILSKNSLEDIYLSKINKKKKNIAMGHLSVYGAKFGKSEREIGNLESVSSKIFDGFDYVALGHIHKAQIVDKNIVYSGSPLSLDFSETYPKKVVLIDSCNMEFSFIEVPKFREFVRLKGSFEYIKKEIDKLKPDSFVEIELDEVISSFDLDSLDRDDIFVLKKIMPYKKAITKKYETKDLNLDSLIEEIFCDDKDFQEIKKIILSYQGIE